MRRPRDVPVGLVEIATIFNAARSTVDGWRTRRTLPPPTMTVGGHPAWWLSDILTWAHQTGRTARYDIEGAEATG